MKYSQHTLQHRPNIPTNMERHVVYLYVSPHYVCLCVAVFYFCCLLSLSNTHTRTISLSLPPLNKEKPKLLAYCLTSQTHTLPSITKNRHEILPSEGHKSC